MQRGLGEQRLAEASSNRVMIFLRAASSSDLVWKRSPKSIRSGPIADAPTISAASMVAEFMSPVTPFEFSR